MIDEFEEKSQITETKFQINNNDSKHKYQKKHCLIIGDWILEFICHLDNEIWNFFHNQ
jgi:hypothetical protein